MKEFMFYIRNEKDAKKSLTEEKHFALLKGVKFIGKLKSENKLIAAQPLVREGVVIKKDESGWTEKNISSDAEVQVGYYYILDNDIDESIKISKANPEFEYVPSASIEVRPVKTKEKDTGFVYPK